MVNVRNLKVLVAGTVPSVTKHIDKAFRGAGCQTERIMKAQDIFDKIDAVKPDVVVLDIQTEEISTYEVIQKVKNLAKAQVFLVLYSFFVDKDMAKESILHRLFASNTSHSNQNKNRPIKYLGVFNENTVDHKIETFLETLRNEY